MEAEQHFIFCTIQPAAKERAPTLRARIHLLLHSPSSVHVALCFRLAQPPIHSSSFCFACDTITSRIILRFCYSATAADADASVLLVPLRCLLLRRRRSVNVAKLMPFDYIANHEYKEHTIIAPSSSHLRTYSFHSNYSSFPPQLPRQSSSSPSRIVAYQITISNRSEGKEAKSLAYFSSLPAQLPGACIVKELFQISLIPFTIASYTL